MQMADELIVLSDSVSLDCEESADMSKEQDIHNRRTFRLAIVSIVVSAVIGAGNLGYQIYRDHLNKTSADTRFGKIETALRILTGATAPQLEKSVDDSLRSAVVDPTKTKEHVEFAGAVIHQLREASVPMSNAIVKDASLHVENLIDTKYDIPQVWTTAGEFLTYRSQMLAGWEQVNFPLCTTQNPQAQIYKSEAGQKQGQINVTHGPFKFHDCKIILDSPEATMSLSPLLQFADVVLNHCAVFYNGGPVIIVPVKIATEQATGPPIGKLYFNDCIFVFSFSRMPDPNGQRLVKTLLVSAGNTLQFNPS
jgi:hypothetical protein